MPFFIKNNMAIYSISRVGKNITVSNISNEAFTLDVQFDKYCSENCTGCTDCGFISIVNTVVQPGRGTSLAFNEDGKYLVTIRKGTVAVDTLEYNIYEELKEAVINSVFDNFCDDCGDRSCCKKKDKISVLTSCQACIESILTYSLLKGYSSNAIFTKYLQIAFDFYKCNFTITEKNKRNFLKFLGRNNDKYNLSGKFALIYYIGFYLMESLEDKDNIDALCMAYRIAITKLCATNYNLMVEDLEDFFLQSIVLNENAEEHTSGIVEIPTDIYRANVLTINSAFNTSADLQQYPNLLIPGSYGVYFDIAPLSVLPTQKNFTLKVDFASHDGSGAGGEQDFTHTLIVPETGRVFTRTIKHNPSGQGFDISAFTEISEGTAYKSNTYVLNTNGFNATYLWVEAYKFLLIPGSYGVYFTTPPIPQLLPNQLNFSLMVDYASYKNSGGVSGNSGTDYVHTLIDPNTGKTYVRKVYLTTNGYVCTQFTSVVPDYVGTPVQGVNGTDTEFIYKLSATPTGIPIPETSQNDNYIPNGWSPELSSVNDSLPYGFMSKRKRNSKGVWSLFSLPALVSHYAKNGSNGTNGINGINGTNGVGLDGKDGAGVEFVFKRTELYVTPDPITTSPNVDDAQIEGWTDDPTGVNSQWQYEWVSTRRKKVLAGTTTAVWGNFSAPALWAKYTLAGVEPGIPGEPGKDGREIDFVYKLTSTSTPIEAPAYQANDVFNPIDGWVTDMLGISETNKYLWCSRRYKAGGVWSPFTTPVIWAVFSEDGKDGTDGKNGADGKSYEYIFARTQTLNTPKMADADRHVPYIDDFVPKPFEGFTWTDNPSGVTATWVYEWVSTRIKSNGAWGAFSPPAIWSKWSEDGSPGVNAASLHLSREIINISCMADGFPRTGTIPTDVILCTFDGINPAVATIVAIPDNNSTKINMAATSEVGVYKLTLTDLQTNEDTIRISATILIDSLGEYVTISKVIHVFKTIDGYAGPTIVSRGAYLPGTTYYGNSYRVDVVSITQNGVSQWYILRTTAGEVTGISPLDEGQTKWDVMASFEMIATGVLFAENANIAEFIFNAGKLKSQYPTEVQPQNPNGKKNLELDGTVGTITLNSTLGELVINKDGIVLKDEEGNAKVSIYKGDIPTIQQIAGTTVTQNITGSSSNNSFVVRKELNVGYPFEITSNSNSISFNIPTRVTFTKCYATIQFTWLLKNLTTFEESTLYAGFFYTPDKINTAMTITLGTRADNKTKGTYQLILRMTTNVSENGGSATQIYQPLVFDAGYIVYQNVAQGTIIGKNGIASVYGSEEYFHISKTIGSKVQIQMKGDVYINGVKH